MSIRGLALILLAIVGICLLLVSLGETQGSDWAGASSPVALASVLIMFIAIAAAVVVGRD